MKYFIYVSLFLIITLHSFSGCKKTDAPGASTGNSDTLNSAVNNGSGYIDAGGWELAQKEIKTIEKTVEAFNNFYDVWGWAYEHRVFQRYKEAIETAGHLPGKLDEIKKLAGSINPVENYPEIGNIKNCYMQMIPQLEGGAQNLKDSIIAARDSNTAEEKKLIQSYNEKWKAAMGFSRKSFTIMQELLTRGSRVEYGKLTGGKGLAPAAFKSIIKSAVSEYDGQVNARISAVKKLAAGSQWDVAIIKSEEIYSILQKSIMKAGQAEPGSDRNSWNIRQELITALSGRMMAMKKFGEYMELSKNGNALEAAKTLKVYEIMEKSAADARSRLKKLGY